MGVLHEKLVVDRLPVRVKRRVRQRDRIRIGTPRHHVLRRDEMDASHAATLARVDYLALVPRIIAHALACAKRKEHKIRSIRIVNKSDIRILVACTENLWGRPHTLKRKLPSIDEFCLLPCNGREIRISGGVNGAFAAHHAARAVGHHNDCADKVASFHDHAFDKRAVPDLGTGLPRLAAEPFALSLAVDAGGFLDVRVDLRRESFAVAIAIVSDQPLRHDAAHHVQILRHNRTGAGAGRSDRSRSAAGSGTSDKHIAFR